MSNALLFARVFEQQQGKQRRKRKKRTTFLSARVFEQQQEKQEKRTEEKEKNERNEKLESRSSVFLLRFRLPRVSRELLARRVHACVRFHRDIEGCEGTTGQIGRARIIFSILFRSL